MKLVDADLEQSFFQAPRKIADRSIGYIVIGLLIVLFFLIFLFGLQQVQSVADHVTGDRTRTESSSSEEIGDAADLSAR